MFFSFSVLSRSNEILLNSLTASTQSPKATDRRSAQRALGHIKAKNQSGIINGQSQPKTQQPLSQTTPSPAARRWSQSLSSARSNIWHPAHTRSCGYLPYSVWLFTATKMFRGHRLGNEAGMFTPNRHSRCSCVSWKVEPLNHATACNRGSWPPVSPHTPVYYAAQLQTPFLITPDIVVFVNKLSILQKVPVKPYILMWDCP